MTAPFVYTGPTHRFRPVPGNAVFCADCPPGDSVAERGNPRHVGDPFPLDVAVTALNRVPTETLVAILRSRNLSHGTHNALRSYHDPAVCFVCDRPMTDLVDLR